MALDIAAVAAALDDAWERRSTIAPISSSHPDLDVAAAYEVLHHIERGRLARGWIPLGWKIGFTNRTLWPRYGVWQPMWARIWDRTVHQAPDGTCALDVDAFVQPRLEPEVVFCLRDALPPTDDATEVLARTEWIAAGFEVVQSHFPEWRFTAADCTAAFGLHGALVVGRPLAIDPANRAGVGDGLPELSVTLRRDAVDVDHGVASVVLDGPAHALAHLSRSLAEQGVTLGAGEIVTTGTITDAWPIRPGETWTSQYDAVDAPVLEGLTLVCTGAS